MTANKSSIMRADGESGSKKMLREWRAFILRQSRSMLVRSIILVVVLAVTGLITRLIFLVPFVQQQVEEMSASRQMSIAEYVANDIGDSLTQRVGVINNLAALFPVELRDDPKRAETWLAERYKILPLFTKGLVLIPVSGKGNVVDYPVVTGRRDLDFSNRAWFGDAIRAGQAVAGPAQRSRLNGEPLFVVAAPVMDVRGQVVAVLAGVTALGAQGFLDTLQQTKIGANGGFLLLSPKDRIVVAATDVSRAFQPLPPTGKNDLYDRAFAGFRGTGLTTNRLGVQELAAVVSVPNSDWILMAKVPIQEIYQPMERIRHYLERNTFIIAAVVLLVMLPLLLHHLKPLHSTARLMHRMATGEAELQPIPIQLEDEVGELVRGFNFLLARVEDITAQKLASERRRRQEKEQIETMLRQWMADTSHELRTPIAVLRAQIEAIQDGIHTANPKTLDVLHREVVGLSRLVDDLHMLALSDVQQFNGQMVPVDPLEVLDEMVEIFHDRFQTAGLGLRYDPGAVRDVQIHCDPSHLRRVFTNLLENSLRYTDAGGELVVSAQVGPDDVVLHFDDTAPSVPEQALPHLFDRFYRVDPSRSREYGGSGIGLAVSQAIIQAYGGTIAAVLSPLGGIRIILQLHLIRGEP